MKGKTTGRYGPGSVSTRLSRIAEMARVSPDRVLTTLAHNIDLAWLGEAYRLTRKDGASGIDGVTAKEYAGELETRLKSLLERFKSGSYFAPPVRRVEIPKGDGRKRPIGIPTFEDKVLQRAVAMALEAVYEQDFLPCSHGFRPGRSAHTAIEQLWKGLMKMGGGWVLDLDVQSFFDSLSHARMREILDLRIRDGVIRRVIGKWLKAGVMSEGVVTHSREGTPQGGVISPILANVYLHDALDRWFEEEVRPKLRGRAFMVRYADDAVLVFANREEAEQVWKALERRLEGYDLRLHLGKTHLVDFRRPQKRGPGAGGRGPGTFDMLGFTHAWGRSRKGNLVVRRKTSKKRVQRAARRLNVWCREHRHDPIRQQHRYLSHFLRGHCGYYGITGNSHSLRQVRDLLQRIWRRWLNRRSQNSYVSWERFKRIVAQFAPMRAVTVHSVLRRP